MRVDVAAFIGEYPWRPVPGTRPEDILMAMERVGVDEAWVSNLASVAAGDPAEGNRRLYALTAAHPRLRPVPAVHPHLSDWHTLLADAAAQGAPAVRSDPTLTGTDPAGEHMRGLASACGEHGIPLLLSVRLEDRRQRHPGDHAPELEPWAIRSLLRSDAALRLLVTHADRDFIEQVHFGSTPEEARRILWDVSWIWGPPEDHLQLLLRTVGVERFVFGTGMPLRIPEASIAKLDLLDLTPEERAAIESENIRAFV